MKNKKIKLFLSVFFITIGEIALFSQDTLISLSQKKKVIEALQDINKAPDFTLQTVNDSNYTLSELEGQVVLVNFWATWCGPCRMEIPEFNELYNSYHENPLLYGNTRNLNKIMKDYGGVYAVPSTFLIGKKGSIIWKYPGAILKDYDPQTFASLVYEIEKELIKSKENGTIDK